MKDFVEVDYHEIPDFCDDNLPVAKNPEQQTACMLLLDPSYSTRGHPITELNKGIQTFLKELRSDEIAAQRVEVAAITFGGTPQVVSDFTAVDKLAIAPLKAGGDTPMGAAIEMAVPMLERRLKYYQDNGIPYTRPWVFLMTDGGATDDITKAMQLIHHGEQKGKFMFFGVGIGGNVDMVQLAQICAPNRPPVRLQGLKFQALFEWLSASLSSVSVGAPGQQLALPPLNGWAVVNN